MCQAFSFVLKNCVPYYKNCAYVPRCLDSHAWWCLYYWSYWLYNSRVCPVGNTFYDATRSQNLLMHIGRRSNLCRLEPSQSANMSPVLYLTLKPVVPPLVLYRNSWRTLSILLKSLGATMAWHKAFLWIVMLLSHIWGHADSMPVTVVTKRDPSLLCVQSEHQAKYA